MVVTCCSIANAQSARRGRGRGSRSRGRVNMRRDGPMKFEEDFDFETANAQFHKDELDKELQTKLKLKGKMSSATLVTNIDTSYLFYSTVILFVSVSLRLL